MARLLGWAGLTLDDNPDQRAELVADFSLIPNAVEELLRYEAPSPVQSRWCLADVEVHGRTIPANSKVVMITGLGRAGRACLPRRRSLRHPPQDGPPPVLRLRDPLLPGEPLARMEGRVALEETLRRFPEWTVDLDGGSPPLHQHGAGLHEAADRRLTPVPPGPPGRRSVSGTLALTHPALVAQRTRASDYGSEGWGFESLRARVGSS